MGTKTKDVASLGVTWSMGYEQVKKGFTYIQKETQTTWEKFGKLKASLVGTSNSIVSSIGNMAKVGGRHFGTLVKGLEGMADSAMNTSLPYATMAAEFGKNFSAMTVGMNITASESKKWQSAITSAGYRTGESMDGIAKGFVEAKIHGVDLEKALGTRGMTNTMSRLAKVSSVFGIEAEKLTGTFAILKKQFNIDEVAAKTMGDRIFTIGKVFNVGREAVQQWPDIIASLSREFADMGKKASPEDLKRFSESIITLGGSISTALGKPAAESIELSKQLFTTLAGNRRGISDMFRGMGGDIGKLGMQVVETGGSVDDMFALINKDPEKFMEGLQRLAKTTKESGGEMSVQFQRLVGSIDQTLGPDVTNLMRANWGEVNKKLREVPAALKGSADAMGRAAEANHKYVGSGNEVQFMIERFELRMSGLVRGSKEYSDWKNNLSQGFKEIGDKVAGLAQDKGPIGSLTRRFLLMQKVGLSGLFTQTSGSLGAMTTMLTGAVGALSKLGIRLSDIPTLLSASGPLLLGFAVFDKGLRNDIIGSIGKAALWLKSKAPKMLIDAFSSAKKDFDELKNRLGPMFTALVEGIKQNLPIVEAGLGDMIQDVDWAVVGKSAGDWAARAAEFLGGSLASVSSAMWKTLWGDPVTQKGLNSELGKALGTAFKYGFMRLGASMDDWLGELLDAMSLAFGVWIEDSVEAPMEKAWGDLTTRVKHPFASDEDLAKSDDVRHKAIDDKYAALHLETARYVHKRAIKNSTVKQFDEIWDQQHPDTSVTPTAMPVRINNKETNRAEWKYRPSSGGSTVPGVRPPAPVPVAAATHTSSQAMAAQLASMNANIAALGARPIQVDLHLDGRKFGAAMFKQSSAGMSHALGNLSKG